MRLDWCFVPPREMASVTEELDVIRFEGHPLVSSPGVYVTYLQALGLFTAQAALPVTERDVFTEEFIEGRFLRFGHSGSSVALIVFIISSIRAVYQVLNGS